MSTLKIRDAINAFEAALRDAVRKDTLAESAEEWLPRKLRASEEAWAKAKAKRLELEAMIDEALRAVGR